MAHGPAAIHELIEDSGWSYPVSVRRLEAEHGLENIALDGRGNSIMVIEVLEGVEADRFESREDLEAMLVPVFEAEREARAPGLLGRLRRLFGY